MTEKQKRFIVIAGIIVLAVVSRLLPHPDNFTPLAAIALFGGAYFINRKWAILVPVLALLFSDILLEVLFATGHRAYPGFYSSMIFVYGGFVAAAGLGMLVGRKINLLSVTFGAAAASVVFFLVTNFGAWLTLPEYAKTFPGLVQAYVAGIPFFRGTLLGDLVYSGIMFGVFEGILAGRPQWRMLTATAE
jgi:hypothetical protein